jgi:hypothetical protein
MVIVKATPESEAGQMPSEAELRDMGNFNEELVKAGVMLAGEGLHPSRRGKRVRCQGKQRTVIDGPFAETRELVAGSRSGRSRTWTRPSPGQPLGRMVAGLMPEDAECSASWP